MHLREKGLDDNTIIVYTSDHGDFLGEHSMLFKCRAVYESLMRIPFVWHWPGHIQSNATCDELVENVDFMPTVLELCGVETPAGVQGVSHAAALLGREPFFAREATFAEVGMEGLPATMADLPADRRNIVKLFWS